MKLEDFTPEERKMMANMRRDMLAKGYPDRVGITPEMTDDEIVQKLIDYPKPNQELPIYQKLKLLKQKTQHKDT